MSKPIATPPDELKQLSPFIQRANELRTADPVMAYWCCYYAAQQGINVKASAKSANAFLMDLMDELEVQKNALSGNDAVTNDTAGAAYIENFALKVFVGADNEDRSGKATRATARKFIAAANFVELLKIFGTLEAENADKLKYAKWKAADIAKAFREGRQPQPGPAGGLEEEGEGAAASGSIPDLATPATGEEDLYVAREMAKLMGDAAPSEETAARPVTPDARSGGGGGGDEANAPIAISPAAPVFPGMPRRNSSARAQSRLSVHSPGGAQSPNFSKPIRTTVSQEGAEDVFGGSSAWGATPQGGTPTADGLPSSTSSLPFSMGPPQNIPSAAASSNAHPVSGFNTAVLTSAGSASALSPPLGPTGSGGGSGFLNLPAGKGSTLSPSGRPLPTPPLRDGLPVPPGPSGALGSGFTSPARSPMLPPTLAQAPGPFAPSAPPASHILPPGLPTGTSTPQLSQAVTAASVGAPSAAPSNPSTLPDSLTPALIARAQKLAKFAVSALDYDDLDTARRQLREALDIVEGRDTGDGKSKK